MTSVVFLLLIFAAVAPSTARRISPSLCRQRCRRRRQTSRPLLWRSGKRSTQAGSARNPLTERTPPPCEGVIGAEW